jgi:kumamolisin
MVFAAPFSERAGFSNAYLAEVTGASPAQGNQLVVVTFQPRSSAFFATPLPGAKPLTTSQVADRFGLPLAEYASIEQYFRSAGLSIDHEWPDRLSLTLEGPVAAIDRAFGTSIEAGRYNGSPVTFPDTPPELPPEMESVVGSVLGLSSGFDTFTFPSAAPGSAAERGPSQASSNLVTPAIARQIYDFSGLYNASGSARFPSSESIALLLWGWGYSPSDIQTFFQRDYPSSFPQPTWTPYPVDGAPRPSANAVNDPCKAAQELTLDIEWAGSMAPGASLDAVYAPEGTPSTSCSPTTAAMTDALHLAIDLPVSAVSMSFGTLESNDGSLAAAWQTYLGEAVQKGITLLAATGDTGGYSQANCQGTPMPEYPATSPDVLAVGGTAVTLDRNLLGQVTGFSESAWNQGGGGFSTQYSAPLWQNNGSGSRGTPDVSASAALNFVFYNGADQTAGGTSFATPLWAGLVVTMDALRGAPFGLISPRLYSVGEAEAGRANQKAIGLTDITSGSNCLGPAGPGWDEETGWGSPRALVLYEDLTATFVNLSIRADPTTVAQGGSVTIAGHLANATTGAAIPGVPVVVSLTSTTEIGPCTGVFGTSTVLTDGSGNLSASVPVPVCYLGSHALASVEVVSDGYYGTNSTTIAVNLLGLVPSLGELADYPYNVAAFAAIIAVAVTVGYVLGRGGSGSRSGDSSAVPPPAAAGYDPSSPSVERTGPQGASPRTGGNNQGG